MAGVRQVRREPSLRSHGRNPQTGATIKIAASTGLKFSASSTLKTELNTKGGKKKK